MDTIAVLIPCYNESQTIAKVVKDYREALPEAVIYVYDNNSTDHTDEAAREAGAQFFLTPSATTGTMEFCRRYDIPLLPGVLTPTDVAVCLEYGYTIMKLFPAGDMPPSYIKSLKGPFDGTEYVAVGGVDAGNIKTFLDNGFIGVGIGSNLIPKEYVKNDAWDKASEYVKGIVGSI